MKGTWQYSDNGIDWDPAFTSLNLSVDILHQQMEKA